MTRDCCPVCRYLLLVLAKKKGIDAFVVRGAHHTVWTCSLPPWLDEEVVDEMIHYFGNILRNELISLKHQTSATLNRHFSRGSAAPSSDGEDKPQGAPYSQGHMVTQGIQIRS